MELVYWIFILFLLLYEPIFGYRDFQKFKKTVHTKKNERIKYYYKTIISLWVPTLLILGFILFTEISFEQIGLKIPAINTVTLGATTSYILLALGALYMCFVLYFIIGYKFSEKLRQNLLKKKTEEWEKSVVSPILPVSKKEKKVWNYVSLTAGITEEIIYRGFLIFVLSYLFPNLSIWIVILFAALLFGLGHTYQGFWAGVVRTTLFGVLFSSLYIILDSIIPLIILHFLVDYIAKLGENEQENHETVYSYK